MAPHMNTCMALAMVSAVSAAVWRPSALRRSRVSKPNILYVLLDDFGWGDAGWHWESGEAPTGLKTPNMTALVKEGVELDRMYGFKVCSPTRSSIQSGRHPLQVNVLNIHATHWNPKDNVSGFQGIPREMTGMAEVLRDAGYETYMFGKWDVGIATWRHSPAGRGYNHALGYWGHGSDYWTMKNTWCGSTGSIDVFSNSAGMPATNLMTEMKVGECSQDMQVGCTYADTMYTNAVKDAIRSRPRSQPFFIFWSMHLVHDPYEVPQEYITPWKHLTEERDQIYHGMVTLADEMIGSVVDLVKSEGLWDSTVVVVHSDNGGHTPISSNAPLRGSKFTNWEGGIRLMSFVSGGFLPREARGTKREFLMQVSDWYATFAHLAGVDDVHDARAEAFGLPPVDSKNAWERITGATSEPIRDYLVIGDGPQHEHRGAWVGGLIRGRYKLVVGEISVGLLGVKADSRRLSRMVSGATRNSTLAMEGVLATDSDFPLDLANTLGLETLKLHDQMVCGREPSSGCLYDIFSNPTENVSIAADNEKVFYDMLREVDRHQKDVFDPDRGNENEEFICGVYARKWPGYVGPFVPGLDTEADFADALDSADHSTQSEDAEEDSTDATVTTADKEGDSTDASATSTGTTRRSRESTRRSRRRSRDVSAKSKDETEEAADAAAKAEDKVEEAADDSADDAEEAAEDETEKAADAAAKAEDKVEEAADDSADDAEEAAEDETEKAADTVAKAEDKVEEAADDSADDAKEAAEDTEQDAADHSTQSEDAEEDSTDATATTADKGGDSTEASETSTGTTRRSRRRSRDVSAKSKHETEKAADTVAKAEDKVDEAAEDSADDAKEAAEHETEKAADTVAKAEDKVDEAAEDSADDAEEAAEDEAEQAADTVAKAEDKVDEAAEDSADDAEEVAGDVTEKAADTVAKAEDKVDEAAEDSAAEAAEDETEKAADTVAKAGNTERDSADHSAQSKAAAGLHSRLPAECFALTILLLWPYCLSAP